jgi:hypothetical protein
MTVYYLDPVGGNDANAGTSFATRWQSFTSGATAARIGPGDEIRVIASPAADNTSLTGTFTSSSVTLSSSISLPIYNSGAWTAATTNVTLSTSTNRKIGTTCVSIAPNATFTTGKAAYLTLSTLDLSAYEQVTFWINMTAGTMNNNGDVSLVLCSDTLGNTPVHTISIPRVFGTTRWLPVTFNNSASLSSSIQSIALYINVDLGAQTFLISNVVACKSAGSSDSITLNTMVGQSSTGPWFDVQSINGNILTFQKTSNDTVPADSTRPTVPDTGSFSVFKMEPLLLPTPMRLGVYTFGTVQDSGSAGSPIIISGGWNTTDMSTQTGETFISGVDSGPGFQINSKNYINYSKLSFFRFNIFTISASSFLNVSNFDLISTGNSNFGANASNVSVRNCFIVSGSTGIGNNSLTLNIDLYYGSSSTTLFGFLGINNTINILRISRAGTSTQPSNFLIDSATGRLASSTINIGPIENCYVGNFFFCSGGSNSNLSYISKSNKFNFTGNISLIASGSGIYYFQIASIIDTVFNFNNVSITNSGSSFNGFIQTSTNGLFSNILISNLSIAPVFSQISRDSTVTFINCPIGSQTFTDTTMSSVTYGNVAGVSTDQRIYYPTNFGNILTDSTIRKTPSGVSWKMTSGSVDNQLSPTQGVPLTLPLAQIAVNASSLVTAKVWVYRTDTNLVTKFVCPGGQIAGVSSDVVATASGAINTWEQLTITFTPSAAGVVALQVQCYGAAASVYVDDFEATQA